MRRAEGGTAAGREETVVVRLPERFEQFYEREYHRVVSFAYALGGSWWAAEDAAQEAFLRAHREWERVATGPACHCPGDVAAGPGGVWVLRGSGGAERGRLLRVDPQTDQVVAGIPILSRVSYVSSGDDGTAWVVRLGLSPGDDELLQVDPAGGSIIRAIPLPAIETGGRVEAMLVAGGAVWIADSAGRLLRVDTTSGQVHTVPPSGRDRRIVGLAAAGGGIWVASRTGLQRLDPEDGRVTLQVSDLALQQAIPADGLAAGAGALWLVGGGDAVSDRLLRIDPVRGWVVGSLGLRRPGREGLRAAVVAADERVVAVRRGVGLFVVAGDGSRVRAYVELPGGDGGVAVGGGRCGRPTGWGGGGSGSRVRGGEGRPGPRPSSGTTVGRSGPRPARSPVNPRRGAGRRTPRPGREAGSGR
jgi:hypothetical protein